jgi:hypothetical protein
MAMNAADDKVRACDLCGLPVERDDFRIRTPERILHFCCEGCQGIYRLLHQPVEVDGGAAKESADE